MSQTLIVINVVVTDEWNDGSLSYRHDADLLRYR
jgi:hypothetical protein